MTPAEEQDAKRKDRAAKVAAAWSELSMSSAFDTVFKDAQLRHGMFQDSFQEKDGFNPHAAAKRDGIKHILNDFARRLARGLAFTEDESSGEKPTSAL